MQSLSNMLAWRIHDIAHAALWAALAVGMTVVVSTIQRSPEARALAERQRVLELAAESDFYCNKWGIAAGTHEHTICTLNVQEMRAKHEKRLTDDMRSDPEFAPFGRRLHTATGA